MASVVERRLAAAGSRNDFCSRSPVWRLHVPDHSFLDADFPEERLALPCRARVAAIWLAHRIRCDAVDDAFEPGRIERLGWLARMRKELDAGSKLLADQAAPEDFFALSGSGGERSVGRPRACGTCGAYRARNQFVSARFFGPADDETQREFEAAMPGDVKWQP